MSTPDTLTGPDGHPYAVRLTREQVAGIAGHFHWIPATRGYLSAYVAREHPGWNSNEFARVFNTARILANSSVGGPPHPHKWLVAVWISSNLEWLVESTRSYRPVHSSRNA